MSGEWEYYLRHNGDKIRLCIFTVCASVEEFFELMEKSIKIK